MPRHPFWRRFDRASTEPFLQRNLLATAAILALAATARADDYFINTSGGDWATAANWSENAPPTSTENAYLGYDIGSITFADPASATVTLSGNPKTIQSLYSKSNLLMQPPGSMSESILNLRGTTLSFDPSVSITLGALSTATFTTASLEMKPLSGGEDLIVNANINEGYLGEVAFGGSAGANSVTYGAGYTWNITSPTPGAGGNTTNAYNLDAYEVPFFLNGTLNMTNGSSAIFASPASGSGAALTIGSTGKLIVNGSYFNAYDVNNQGSMSLTGADSASHPSTAFNFTNSGSFSASGGATFSNGGDGTNIATNNGSMSIDGNGTDVLLENPTGNGSISVTNSGELDLETFNNSLLDHISADATAKFMIGGTVTTDAGGTFDFTRLGSNVSFGINYAHASYASGVINFVGGNVIHSDQLDNVGALTNVTLDHGLTTTSQLLNHQTVIGGIVNAGDKPITVSGGTTLVISDGATLNGDVTITSVTNGFSTLNIGGTLNGNIANTGQGILELSGHAHTSATITNTGTLEGQIENGELVSGSNLDLTAASYSTLGNFTFDSGSSIALPKTEILVQSSWSNAGTITFPTGGFLVPDFDTSQPITNTGTIIVPSGQELTGFENTQFEPLINSGTVSVPGHWMDLNDSPRTVTNTGNVSVGSTGEIDQWNETQSAGKTLINGLFYFVANQNNPAFGTLAITGGTLAGSGTIQRYNASVGGGTLIGGDDGSPAQMSFIDSTLALDSGATVISQILDSTHFGHFTFSSTASPADDSLTLGGTLDVSLLPAAAYTYGESFTLFSADQITGAFDTINLPTGWQYQSTPTTFDVIALPEPASLLTLAALGALSLTHRRRHSLV